MCRIWSATLAAGGGGTVVPLSLSVVLRVNRQQVKSLRHFRDNPRQVALRQPIRQGWRRQVTFNSNLCLPETPSTLKLLMLSAPAAKLATPMFTLFFTLLGTIRSCFQTRAALQLEILALRHQINVLRRLQRGRIRLTEVDRLLWAWLLNLWSGWRSALIIVRPETVLAWHRRGFRLYWTWKSRRSRTGRPEVARESRELIRKMSLANPLWGAPRIHGELLKLGIEVCQATVAKYMARRRITLRRRGVLSLRTTCSSWSRQTSSWCQAGYFSSLIRLYRLGPRSETPAPF